MELRVVGFNMMWRRTNALMLKGMLLWGGISADLILVVRPTGMENEYTRVGAGCILSDYVARQGV
jgi:hypothetical protein